MAFDQPNYIYNFFFLLHINNKSMIRITTTTTKKNKNVHSSDLEERQLNENTEYVQ